MIPLLDWNNISIEWSCLIKVELQMAHTFVVLPTTRELYLLKMELKYKSKYLRSWTSINKTKTNPSLSNIRSSDVLHDDTEVWCPLDFKTCPKSLVLVFL